MIKKIFSLFAAILFAGSLMAADEVYKTAAFTIANCTKSSSYTGSVTCKVGSDTWTAANAANNNGKWDYIKMGGKRASGGTTTVQTGTIVTSASYSEAITKVVVNGSLDRGTVSAKLIYASNSSFTEDMVESNALTAFTSGKMTFTIASPVANRYYKLEFVCSNSTTTNGVISISSVEYYKEAGSSDPTACATPSFDPAAGAVLAGTEVEILCETEGATIHYTTDGTEPTASSQTYSSAITIDEAKTIKAIAVKSGLSNSAVATAEYTLITPLATMQDIFNAATSSSTMKYITFSESWVVTGVTSNGKTAYLTDGTKGLILYNSSDSIGLAVGNTLSGTIQCALKKYNGSAELENFTTTGLTKGTADLPAVQELDAEGIAALGGVNTGSLIKISGVASVSSEKYYVAGVQLYNSLYSFTNPASGKSYDVTGVYLQYNSTKEIMPRSAEDIKEFTPVEESVVITSTSIDAPVDGKSGTINVTYNNVDKASAVIAVVEADGTTPATYSWLTTSFDEDKNVEYEVAANTGEARTAYLKVLVGEVASDLVTISQAKYVVPYATLPFAFDGGVSDIAETSGLTENDLGSDYKNSPYLKFDGTGDYLILQINEDAGVLAFDVKGNGFSGGTFTVQTSEDGETYTDLKAYTDLGDTQTEIFKIAADVRYIKWIYTEKKNGNVALGNISVSKDTYEIKWSLGAGADENLGVLGKMGDSDSYAKYFDKEILNAGIYDVKLYKNGAATPIATTTLEIEQEEAMKYYLQFDYNASTGEFTATASNPRTATAVDNTVDGKKAVKFIENGQLFIELNGHVYNVQGQVVK